MQPHNPKAESLAQQQREKEESEKKVRRLCKAYLVVFGDWEKGPLSDAQRIVKEDLEQRGYIHRTTHLPDGHGAVDPIRAAIAEGARVLVNQLKEFIRYAVKAPPE